MTTAYATASGMDVLVFRTNIRFKKDLRQVAPVLDEAPGLVKWTVDREDTDKVLRIETRNPDPSPIISLVESAGYFCEELPG
ncbi:hypothetical protein WJU16_18205 [Chitinophaga pollutisoli]|uniref:Copper chaperone CopZ n=1 Tax=Chitinophaga pollutisoli TaxID=3133966 RepID=A0ABZ2YJL4_9BACT